MLNYNTQPLSCHRQITLSNLTKFAHKQSQTRFPSYQCMYQVWLKSLDIYSSYCPEKKIWACLGQTTESKFDKICTLAIPNQISTISMHIPSLVKIHWCLLKLSSRNENMGGSLADNSVKNWQNLPSSNPKPDLHNIKTHTKFEENPLMFTQVIIQKGKMDGRMYDWRTDRHTDVQHKITIPCHYRVAGYIIPRHYHVAGIKSNIFSMIYHNDTKIWSLMSNFSTTV